MNRADRFYQEAEKIKWLKQNRQELINWLDRIESQGNNGALKEQLREYIKIRNIEILKQKKVFDARKEEAVYRFLITNKLINESKEIGAFVHKGVKSDFTKLLSDFLQFIYLKES